MIIDKNLLSWEGSIGISVLYVNEKETGKKHEVCIIVSNQQLFLTRPVCVLQEVRVVVDTTYKQTESRRKNFVHYQSKSGPCKLKTFFPKQS